MPGPSLSTRRLSFRVAMLLTLAVSTAGCSIWDLGPKPDSYVGNGARHGMAPHALTDQGLQAVTPSVPGDDPSGAAMLPGVGLPAGVPGTNPSTLPAATQPNTTRPAANPTTGAAIKPETQPALGRAAAPAAASPEVPQELSVQDAILVGLQNNVSLRVERYNVPITRTGEERALSAFDPTISGSIQGGRTQSGNTIVTTQPTTRAFQSTTTTDTIEANAGITEFLPTGTTITGNITTSNSFYSEAASSLGGNLTVTQSLLRGGGLDVNLASLREAVLATKATQFQLRGVAESLVTDIEQAYWDLAFAERQVAIVSNALDVAQKQLDETNRRIQVEVLSPSERPAAEAEVALRREALIDARSTLETTRLHFMQLITPSSRPFWDRTVTLTTLPFIPPGKMDPLDHHVEVALRMRPEINEAKLQIQRGDLEIVRTKNGLLPRLDLFLTLGKSTFANSFGTSITDINGPGYSALMGVQGDWEPINRAARASYRAAELTRDQLQETMDNLIQTVQFDVRNQYIDAVRTRQQIDASRATRIAQEQTLAVEQGKLRAGSGTALDVAIAQRDLLNAQLSEVQAVTNHLKSLVALYRLEGSLLLRRGLEAPGATPIDGIAWKK